MESTCVLPSLKKDYSRNTTLCPRISKDSIFLSPTKGNPFSEFPCKYCTNQEAGVKFRDEGLCGEFKCTKYGGSVIEVVTINHNGTSQQNFSSNSLE